MGTNSNYKIIKVTESDKIRIRSNETGIIFEIFDVKVAEKQTEEFLDIDYEYNLIDGKELSDKSINNEIETIIDNFITKVITDLIKEDADNKKSIDNS